MAFAYDEVMVDLKVRDKLREDITKKDKVAKYVPKLLVNAKRKEQEFDLLFEKKLQNELKADKERYGETAKYITPEYKLQLEKNKAFAEQERLLEEEEKKNSVEGRGSINDFYFNLCKNISLGNEKNEMPKKRNLDSLPQGPDEKEVDEFKKLLEREKEKERNLRRREREVRDAEEAQRLKEEREKLRAERLETLKDKYRKHGIDEEDIGAAKDRYEKRKKERELKKLEQKTNVA